MTESKMLTFEIVSEGDEIEIHSNKQGIKDLIYFLQRLSNSQNSLQNHAHLMTPSWGDGELSEVKQGDAPVSQQ